MQYKFTIAQFLMFIKLYLNHDYIHDYKEQLTEKSDCTCKIICLIEVVTATVEWIIVKSKNLTNKLNCTCKIMGMTKVVVSIIYGILPLAVANWSSFYEFLQFYRVESTLIRYILVQTSKWLNCFDWLLNITDEESPINNVVQ